MDQKSSSKQNNSTAVKRKTTKNQTMEEIELTTGNKRDQPQTASSKKLKPYIGDYDDPNLEEFVKDNPHLRTGFRICYHSYWECAGSLFQIHNETMNVWSHLLGAIFFVSMAFYVYIYLSPTSLHGD